MSMQNADEPLMEVICLCGSVVLVATNHRDTLQAYDANGLYKRHLSMAYDRSIGTLKGTGVVGATFPAKDNKRIYLC